MNVGDKLVPRNPSVFADFSGFFGDGLPDYFVVVELETAENSLSPAKKKKEKRKSKTPAETFSKGYVSALLHDPRKELGSFMSCQWFHQSLFNPHPTHLKVAQP